jgi:hypothetical protein
MSLIDSHGRLFGRVNVLDALVGILVLGLIPLGYGAFLMFREKTPALIALQPNQIPQRLPAILQVTGENLRPFLEARLGDVTARGFNLQSPTGAYLLVPSLPEGTYDLTLLDTGRVVATLPNALTVMAPGWSSALTTEVQVLGTFVGLSAEDAAAIHVGAQVKTQEGESSVGEVLAVQASTPATQRLKVAERTVGTTIQNEFITLPVPGEVRVRAILRLGCVLRQEECKIGETVLKANALMILPGSSGAKSQRFVVDEVRNVNAPVTFPPAGAAIAMLQVRFVALPQVMDVLKVGDIDIPASGVTAEADRAQLTTIGSGRQSTTALVTSKGILRQSIQESRPMVAFLGTVRVPVVFTPAGWSYKDRPLKVGGVFHFETITGGVTGSIVGMTVAPRQ